MTKIETMARLIIAILIDTPCRDRDHIANELNCRLGRNDIRSWVEVMLVLNEIRDNAIKYGGTICHAPTGPMGASERRYFWRSSEDTVMTPYEYATNIEGVDRIQRQAIHQLRNQLPMIDKLIICAPTEADRERLIHNKRTVEYTADQLAYFSQRKA
jgi:hypothetical protein